MNDSFELKFARCFHLSSSRSRRFQIDIDPLVFLFEWKPCNFITLDHENPMPRAMAAATKGMNKRANTSARNHH